MQPPLPDAVMVAQFLEALMLLCFGLAWPINSLGMLRRKRPEGKGLAFTVIIWSGYVAGASAKLLLAAQAGNPLPPVFWLYVLNGVTVGANAALYLHFRRHVNACSNKIPPPLADLSVCSPYDPGQAPFGAPFIGRTPCRYRADRRVRQPSTHRCGSSCRLS